jgi:3-dehydroquinate dehydratase type I
MHIQYCLPIVESEISRVTDRLGAAGSYAFIEIWLDPLSGTPLSERRQLIEEISRLRGGSAIFVLRKSNLEEPSTPAEERQQLAQFVLSGNALLDLDVRAQHAELRAIGKHPNLICSYHNYSATPPNEELERVVGEMEPFSPAIYKLSTFCGSAADAHRLLGLLLTMRAQGKRSIVLGMGSHGAATRIFGALWGNEMIFAPEDAGRASAPGQLTRKQLEAIFSNLESGA